MFLNPLIKPDDLLTDESEVCLTLSTVPDDEVVFVFLILEEEEEEEDECGVSIYQQQQKE